MAGPRRWLTAAATGNKGRLTRTMIAKASDELPLADQASRGEPVLAGGGRLIARRRGRRPGRARPAGDARDQHGGERDRGGRDDRGQEQAVPRAEGGQPGRQEQGGALADAERGLEQPEPRVPLGPRPALDDQQVGHRDGAREAGPVGQGERQLAAGCGQREQPERHCHGGRARHRQDAVRGEPVGEAAHRWRRERADVERAHDDAHVPDAVAAGRQRQQNRGQAERGPVHERERREPGFDQPQPARAGQGRERARAAGLGHQSVIVASPITRN
jgi:hypothetical protein